MEHWFAISSGTPDTGCRLPPTSHPVVFSFLILNNATRASSKKLIFLDLATSSYGSPQSIRRCMLFFFFFFVQPSFFAYNLVDLSEARFSENVVVPAETFGRISKSLDKFATIPVDSFVATAFSELSFYLSSVMLCREFLKSGANFFKENFSTSFVV